MNVARQGGGSLGQGRLAGWKLAARVGEDLPCLLHALQHPAPSRSRGLQTYRTSKQWASYSAATDGPEMDLVEVRRSSTWSPQDLACAGVRDW